MSDKNHRIKVFSELGTFLQQFASDINTNHHLNNTFFEAMQTAMQMAQAKNRWFTPAVQQQAFGAWAETLTVENLSAWMNRYPDLKEPQSPKKVAVIMAGNIPLVGFHDFLTVLLLGHSVIAKLSKDDSALFPVIRAILVELYPAFKTRIVFADRIDAPDAVIATGSNNSARYFESYFGKYPHIIRKNRTSVALLNGSETEAELKKLGADIFSYYGLGCRNVSKIYVPAGYDLNAIFGAIVSFDYVADNNKYVNNYEYYRTIYMLNKIPFLENGFVIFKQDTSLHTPIAVLHYEYFDALEKVHQELAAQAEELQCIVGNWEGLIPFGKAQQPDLWDYADGVDTVEFLMKLSS